MKKRYAAKLIAVALLVILLAGSTAPAYAIRQMESTHIIDGPDARIMSSTGPTGVTFTGIRLFGRFCLYAITNARSNSSTVRMAIAELKPHEDTYHDVRVLSATNSINLNAGNFMPGYKEYFATNTDTFSMSASSAYQIQLSTSVPYSIRGLYESWLSNEASGN